MVVKKEENCVHEGGGCIYSPNPESRQKFEEHHFVLITSRLLIVWHVTLPSEVIEGVFDLDLGRNSF